MAIASPQNHSQERDYARHINGSDPNQDQASDHDSQSFACQYCEKTETSKDALDQHSAACAKKTDECPKCRKFVARDASTLRPENSLTPQPPPTPRERSSLRRSASSASQRTRPVAHERPSHSSIIRIPCQFCKEAVELPIWSTHIQDCREKENRQETHSAQSSRRNSMSIEAPPRRTTPANNEHPTKSMATFRTENFYKSQLTSLLNSSSQTSSNDSFHQTNSGHHTPAPHTRRSSSLSSNGNTQKIEQSKPRGNSPAPARRSPSLRPPMNNDSKPKATNSSKKTSAHEPKREQTPKPAVTCTQSQTRASRPTSSNRSSASSRTSSASVVRPQSVSSRKGSGRGGLNPDQSNASKPLAETNVCQKPNADQQGHQPIIMNNKQPAADKKKSDGKTLLRPWK
ncbi:unnamed protein product [Adineta ricciae]|uniref:Uncharacterized protein n=1 Tax=Adineta ricciae TaxID=249248 RepID=A0A815F528_ADIRI|nr:unnamed protein product [Adineta ricciae]